MYLPKDPEAKIRGEAQFRDEFSKNFRNPTNTYPTIVVQLYTDWRAPIGSFITVLCSCFGAVPKSQILGQDRYEKAFLRSFPVTRPPDKRCPITMAARVIFNAWPEPIIGLQNSRHVLPLLVDK